MSTYDFDTIINRRHTDSSKWSMVGGSTPLPDDVIPMWLADMDFQSPPEVVAAIQRRTEHGVFGYAFDSVELKEVICARLKRLYNWEVTPEEVLFSPGVLGGMGATTQSIGNPGDQVLMQTPIFGPFFRISQYCQRIPLSVDLETVPDDAHTFHYEIDFNAFEQAASNPKTSIFYLCNPHNPGGFALSRDDLERIVEICLKHQVAICSDEVHSDLLFDDAQHIPIATLSPEINQNTVTLISPSKTFNLAGLACSVIIVQNKSLRKKIQEASQGMDMMVNVFGFAGAIAAYRDGDAWHQQLLAYLQGNRDYALQYFRQHIPQIKTTRPSATYLLWMDCRSLSINGKAVDFFLGRVKVALTDGAEFGMSGEGFVRLNFGCPRSMLEDALERIRNAL